MNPGFLSELDSRDLGNDGQKAELLADLIYRTKVFGEEAVIIVPAGFVTDFASVGRWPLLYWLFGNTARRPAVVHDYLYQTHLSETKFRADKVFNEAMDSIDLPHWRRRTMFSGVALFGFSSWHSGPKRFKLLGNITRP